MRSLALLGVAVAVSCGAWGAEELAFDQYGGWLAREFEATGFFRTQQDAGGRWWLVTPEGHGFLSIGMNHIQHGGDRERGTGKQYYLDAVEAKYDSKDAWAKAQIGRFRDWGLNTVAGWSGVELRHALPFTVGMAMAPGSWRKMGEAVTPDFFADAFAARAAEVAAGLKAHVDDPWLIGYFLDNELPWSPDHRQAPDLFRGYLRMPADAPGKQRLVAFFKARHGTVARFNEVWHTAIADWAELGAIVKLTARDLKAARADRHAFIGVVADRYFKVTTEAVRAVDPNHLILGARFIWQTALEPVVAACGRHCDVVTMNFYETGLAGKVLLRVLLRGQPGIAWDGGRFAQWSAIAGGKPLMITEFSFRGSDTPCPNSYPPRLLVQPVVRTQQARGEKYAHYVALWALNPAFVGWHWFQLMDQPAGGRFDGENSNFGFVSLEDEPHETFLDYVRQANRDAWRLHAGSGGE